MESDVRSPVETETLIRYPLFLMQADGAKRQKSKGPEEAA